LTMTGMLCNSRRDFTDVGLYAEDTVFTKAFGIDNPGSTLFSVNFSVNQGSS